MTEELLAGWRAEADRPHEGWDFTALRGRMVADDPPWDFDATCRQALRQARRVLDQGTGGGEWLTGFAEVLPDDVTATEGWEPNVAVASARLTELGVPVVSHDPDQSSMPFGDGSFDLVLNRHAAVDVTDVARVLVAGGTFLTQQVGGDNLAEARRLFGGPARFSGHSLARFGSRLRAAGLVVTDSGEWRGPVRFADVGALVRYFTLVPWEVPDDFGVDRYAEVLLRLHERPVEFTQSRFWVRAVKPSG